MFNCAPTLFLMLMEPPVSQTHPSVQPSQSKRGHFNANINMPLPSGSKKYRIRVLRPRNAQITTYCHFVAKLAVFCAFKDARISGTVHSGFDVAQADSDGGKALAVLTLCL